MSLIIATLPPILYTGSICPTHLSRECAWPGNDTITTKEA